MAVTMTAARNLECGDIFTFRGARYVCLNALTDVPRMITFVVAIPEVGHPVTVSYTLQIIFAATFGVYVEARRHIESVRISMTKEELDEAIVCPGE